MPLEGAKLKHAEITDFNRMKSGEILDCHMAYSCQDYAEEKCSFVQTKIKQDDFLH